jgi:glycosyltransferase involved in cell wall biosynthesis
MTLISIALCTYNGERYLADQIESLLAQDHADTELVVCDDGSTDRTWEILQHYAPRFRSCRLVRNECTLGVNKNFEQALTLCCGEWIAPCDQDDVWSPRKLSRLLDAASGQASELLLVYCDSELVDGSGVALGQRVSGRLRMLSGSHPLAFALGNCVSGHAALFRRSMLREALPLPSGLYYDEWLAFVASSVGAIRYVDEALVQFRQHAHNLTGFIGKGDGLRPSPQQLHAKALRKLSAVAGFRRTGSTTQDLVVALGRLWQRRERQWLSPLLAMFMYRHHRELAMTDPNLFRKNRCAYSGKFLWGLRLKMAVWRLRSSSPPRAPTGSS